MRRRGHRATPRHLRRRLHPLAITALVIAATAAVTFYAFNQGLPFVHRFTLHATFANSVNLRGGDPVRVAGIDVGKVASVTPQGDASSVEFTVDRSALPVHRDATIRIRDRLFLEGSYYLELDPGSPGAPALRDGATVPSSQTSYPVQFYQLLSLFDRPTRQSLTTLLDALDQGVGNPSGGSLAQTGAAGFKQAAQQFEPLLIDGAQIARGFQGTGAGDVGTLLRSSATDFTTLAQSSASLTHLVDGLDATSSALASADGALAQSVAGLDQTLRAAPPALRAVDRSLPGVSALARALEPTLSVSPPILAALTATVKQLTAVLAPGERGPLIASLKATFEQLPAILTQLATAFPIGKQVTDCLQSHVLPILSQQVPDGSLSSGQSVLMDFLHFLPGVAGASGSFDADGPYTRYLAGAGTNTQSGAFGGLQLLSTSPPGGQALQGARPQWIGDLTPSDFRPDVPCSTQKVPSLASPTAAADLTPRGSAPAAPAPGLTPRGSAPAAAAPDLTPKRTTRRTPEFDARSRP